jgi:ERCC4-type nuclease
MALILADSREGMGANSFLPALIAQNNRINQKLTTNMGGGNIRFIVKSITTGDYCVLVPSITQKKLELAIVFERKTWKDLAGSIKDGRMQTQFKRLRAIRREKRCSVFYIIEGRRFSCDDTHRINGIPFKNLHAKIRHNLLRGIPYIHTLNTEETAQIIVTMARDIMNLYARNEIKIGGAAQALASQIHSENELPRELCERIVHSDEDIICAMWDAIEGVSSYLATLLAAKYSLGYFIENAQALLPQVADLQYQSGMCVGEVRAEKIINFARNAETHVKILMAIPSVSIVCARVILAQFSLSDICAGKVSEDWIAELLHGENQNRIGPKRAAKIVRLCTNIHIENTTN